MDHVALVHGLKPSALAASPQDLRNLFFQTVHLPDAIRKHAKLTNANFKRKMKADLIRSDLILFPGVIVNVFPNSKLFHILKSNDHDVVGIVPVDGDLECEYGCLASVTRKNRVFILQGTKRFKILDWENDVIQVIEDDLDLNDKEIMGLSSLFKNQVQVFAKMLHQVAPEISSEILFLVERKSPVTILFLFIFLMDVSKNVKFQILSSQDLKYSFEIGLKWIENALKDFKVAIVKIKSRMENSKSTVSDGKNAQSVTSTTGSELEDLKGKVEALKLPEIVMKSIKKDLERLPRINPNNADYHVIFSYLEYVVDLPWDTLPSKVDILEAEKILDKDHQGLDKIKRRILEYIAVFQLTKSLKGPILCLVGPPGTGKTSLGKSIARALDRKFYRIALGGVKDEAQIRGHRRTYVGALPGVIIQSFRKIGVNNPVILLGNIISL